MAGIEKLYSRQQYVLGKDGMALLKKAKILIIGLNGVGVEISKCVVLAGIKEIYLCDVMDGKKIEEKDLVTNYLVTSRDVGENRIDKVINELKILNPYVKITKIFNYELNDFSIFDVVVSCCGFICSNILFDKKSKKFIYAQTFGTMGCVFCDFGHYNIKSDVEKSHGTLIVRDNMYVSIDEHKLFVGSQLYMCVDDHYYDDTVTSIIDEFTFTTTQIIDGKNISYYEIDSKQEYCDNSLYDNLFMPVFNCGIDEEKQQILHKFNIALDMFITKYERFPELRNEKDADIICQFANCSSEMIRMLSKTCNGRFCPLDSVIGGIASHEVLKAVTGLYTPIHQFLYFDILDIVKSNIDEGNIVGYNIFGDSVLEKIRNTRVFMVGAGAIGCEYLKNLAMMGVKNIDVVDMDKIELSNLNRQFLFRNSDIGKYKSIVASERIHALNSCVNVRGLTDKIDESSLQKFNDEYFNSIDLIMLAVDNVDTRLFMDRICVKYKKPMIDTGTLGCKGSVQVIVPYLTESYSSYKDQETEQFAICTIKQFPYKIEHTIQYARELFEDLFVKMPNNFTKYIEDETNDNILDEEIKNDICILYHNNASHINECIVFAIKLFNKYYRDQIKKLLQEHSSDDKTFWKEKRKCPNFDRVTNEMIIEFIYITSNLVSKMYKLECIEKEYIVNFMENVLIEECVFSDINELPEKKNIDFTMMTQEFDKDNDLYMEFVHISSNLRAIIYGIETVTFDKTKKIAGKIIPAIATTTSLMAGLAGIEFVKVVEEIKDYKNSYIDLGCSSFTFFEPTAVKKIKTKTMTLSFWDSITINDMTLKEFINGINEKFGRVVSIMFGKESIFTIILPIKMKNVKLSKKISELCNVTHKNITLSVSIEEVDDPINVCVVC